MTAGRQDTEGAPAIDRAAYRAELQAVADQQRAAGRTVIPVQGALARGYKQGKAPAPGVYWSQFADQRPTDQQHADLFAGDYGGLAILTGRTSGMVALDLDRQADYERLQALHPELCNTYTVRTPRGGVHLYYALDPAALVAPIPTVKGLHGELQADGAYVVAPPTVRNKGRAGARYTVEHDRPLLTCDPAGLQLLVECIRPPTDTDQPAAVDPQPAHVRRIDTDRALVAFFDRQAPTGRNNALYRTALQARRAGLDRETVAALLSPHFLHATAPDLHGRETLNQRARELRATVASAYRAPRLPPDRLTVRLDTPTSTPAYQHSAALPNALREALLQHPGDTGRPGAIAAFVRLWELCDVQGMTGRRVTVQQLVSASGQTPRAVRYALDKAAVAGVPISHDVHRLHPVTSDPDNCVKKSPRGRPRVEHEYTLPDLAALAHWAGARPRGRADQLHSSALRTARTYRRGLHHARVARSLGKRFTYASEGARLGVSGRTIARYHVRYVFDENTRKLTPVRLLHTEPVTRSRPICSAYDCEPHAGDTRPVARGHYVTVTTPAGAYWRMRPDVRRVNWYLRHRPAYALELVTIIGHRYVTPPPEPPALVEFDRQAALDRARFREIQRGRAA